MTDIAAFPPPASQAISTKTRRSLLLVVLTLALCAQAGAQASANNTQQALPAAPQPQLQPQQSGAPSDRSSALGSETVTLRGTPLAILKDQGAIWTSPARIRTKDLVWLAPLAVATGVAIGTDHYTMTNVVSLDPSFNNANINASNVLVGGLIATPVAILGYGQFGHNPHAREAGILGGEAILDGVVVEQGM